MKEIPENIKKLLGNEQGKRIDIGMSGSEVTLYSEYVLKYQPKSDETDNEKQITDWLQGKLPVPRIVAYEKDGNNVWTLMTRMPGEMLCGRMMEREPEKVIALAAEGIRKLWSVDISDCPCSFSRLENRLREAEEKIQRGLIGPEAVKELRNGEECFRDPKSLLQWLKENRPEEDLVLTHGDCCMPNLFEENGCFRGYIDCGKTGPADRWQDIAICARSLRDNFSGKYTGQKIFEDYRDEMFFEALGISTDEKKLRYYLLLDELY